VKSPFSLFLALRYLKPKRTFVSIITLISIIGVMLGIMVLIVVISVMTGFEQELRKKVLGFNPHITVSTRDGVISDWQEMLKTVSEAPNVEAAAPFVQGPVILEFNQGRLAPLMRGIHPELEEKVTRIRDAVKKGSFDLSGDSAIVGEELARKLGIQVGDTVTIYSPRNLNQVVDALKKAEENPDEIEKARELLLPAELTVTGLFSSGRFDYDAHFVLVPLHIGQELYGLDSNDQLHGIAVRTTDPNNPGPIRDSLLARLPLGSTAITWEEQNQQFFEAIAMERNVMFFLLMFIIVVAAFGIMNTLITVTVQKTREIGIMKALGATTWQIVWVFLGQGMIVGVFGNIAGVGLGMLVLQYRNEFKDWLGAQLGVQVFPQEVYQFSKIPAVVVPHDVAVICISAFLICSLAALLPAYFAARLDPVKALRHD